MPITYKYRREDNSVRTRPTGVVTVQEISEYFRQVTEDPAVGAGFIEVAYFDDVQDFAFRYSEAHDIVDAYEEMKHRKACAATVFVTTTTVAYGIARMLSTMRDDPEAMRIVHSEEEVADELERLRATRGRTG